MVRLVVLAVVADTIVVLAYGNCDAATVEEAKNTPCVKMEVVVADGNHPIISEKVRVQGGESVLIPMEAVFKKGGSHHLTAMVNTQNHVVDTNVHNNIVETSVEVR